MIHNVTTGLQPPVPGISRPTPLSKPDGPNFADTLRDAVGDVAQLQTEARSAVEDLATGRTDDLSGVMTAVEKSDLAFRTLLAVRSKLMTAYEEIRNMPI